MNRFRPSLLLSLLGFASLFGTSGCELQKCETDEGESALCLKSLTRYVGTDITPEPLAYTTGMDLTVDGIYGDINVVEGTPGEVAVVIEPFNYRAHDAEDAARDEIENNFDYSFQPSGNAIAVTTGRHDSTNGLGAKITVWLPPEFDGSLELHNDSDGPVNPGDIDADFVGAAWAVDLFTDSLGDCSVSAEGTVVVTVAQCDGVVQALGVSNSLDIASTGLSGGAVVSLVSITGAEAGGSVVSDDGDIDVSFPSGANFSVQAQATAEGIVESDLPEPECVSAIAAENSKSFTCGTGGPSYTVTAGVDGVGESSVELH